MMSVVKAAMRMILMSILQNFTKKCISHIVINHLFGFINSFEEHTIDILPDNKR